MMSVVGSSVQLDLSSRELTELPRDIDWGQLQELNLSGNELSEFPQVLLNCGELRRLDISRNPIGQLPKEIGRLGRLERLEASVCELQDVPDELWRIPQLGFIDLSWNGLETICIGGTIGHPRELDVSHNALTELAHFPSSMREVRKLNASHNQIGVFGEWQEGAPLSMVAMDLSHNLLTTVPQAVGKFLRLCELDISYNPQLKPPAWLRTWACACTVFAQGVGGAREIQDVWNLRRRRELGLVPHMSCGILTLRP